MLAVRSVDAEHLRSEQRTALRASMLGTAEHFVALANGLTAIARRIRV
jgi:hypothetical protein